MSEILGMDKNLFTIYPTTGTDPVACQCQTSSQPQGPMACCAGTRCYGDLQFTTQSCTQRNMTRTFGGWITHARGRSAKKLFNYYHAWPIHDGDDQMAVKVAMIKIQAKTSKNALTEQSTMEQNIQPVIFS